MTESIELRVVEEFANQLFLPGEGKKLGSGLIRLVRIDSDDPRLIEVGRLQKRLRREQSRPFFHGWEIIRRYSKKELDEARLLRLKITSVFEPAGEECGTSYDESTSCPRCRAAARQTGPLILNPKRIPKTKDVSRTIAGEIVVSRRVVELFARHKISGAQFTPIRTNMPSSAESQDWFQLTVSSATAEIIDPTRVGIGPFDSDKKGEYRCPCGDLIGLNLLSEVTIKSDSGGSADIICTRQFIGTRRGFLRPERMILISPKLSRLIELEKLKGVEIEVAHLAGVEPRKRWTPGRSQVR